LSSIWTADIYSCQHMPNAEQFFFLWFTVHLTVLFSTFSHPFSVFEQLI